MYRCVCFNFNKFHEKVDDQYCFKETVSMRFIVPMAP